MNAKNKSIFFSFAIKPKGEVAFKGQPKDILFIEKRGQSETLESTGITRQMILDYATKGEKAVGGSVKEFINDHFHTASEKERQCLCKWLAVRGSDIIAQEALKWEPEFRENETLMRSIQSMLEAELGVKFIVSLLEDEAIRDMLCRETGVEILNALSKNPGLKDLVKRVDMGKILMLCKNLSIGVSRVCKILPFADLQAIENIESLLLQLSKMKTEAEKIPIGPLHKGLREISDNLSMRLCISGVVEFIHQYRENSGQERLANFFQIVDSCISPQQAIAIERKKPEYTQAISALVRRIEQKLTQGEFVEAAFYIKVFQRFKLRGTRGLATKWELKAIELLTPILKDEVLVEEAIKHLRPSYITFPLSLKEEDKSYHFG